jgi:hypothetical protein
MVGKISHKIENFPLIEFTLGKKKSQFFPQTLTNFVAKQTLDTMGI